MGKKTQQKFLYIDFTQVQCKTQGIRLDCFLSSRWIFSSLSREIAWFMFVSKWGMRLPYLYWLVERPNNPIELTYRPNQVRLAFGELKLHFNNTFVGTTNPTYNEGFTSRLYMTKYIIDIPNRRNKLQHV